MRKIYLSIFVLVMIVAPLHAVAADPVAFTAPPPDHDKPPGIYSIFDPDYQYLLNGGTSIRPLGNSAVNILGYSNASQRVNAIGVQITLQQWTGSDWVNVYTSPRNQETSASYINRDFDVNVTRGYYYRTMSYHWTSHGGKEDGYLNSSSILIPN